MKATYTFRFIAITLVCALTTAGFAVDPKIEKKQKEIRDMAQNTLKDLYKADPKAKAVVDGAAGHAVFSDFGVKILVAGSGSGKGIAVNSKTKHETFMKMLEVQAGLGMGVKKFRVVFVFDNEKAFDSFVTPAGSSADKPPPLPKTETRVDRWEARCPFQTVSGCTNSLTRASPSRSPPRAPSTTKTMS